MKAFVPSCIDVHPLFIHLCFKRTHHITILRGHQLVGYRIPSINSLGHVLQKLSQLLPLHYLRGPNSLDSRAQCS